jgi:hypothetical protein
VVVVMPPSAPELLPLDAEPLLLPLEPLLPLAAVPLDVEPLPLDVEPLPLVPLVPLELEPLLPLLLPLSFPTSPPPELPLPLQPIALAQASAQIPIIVPIFIVPSLRWRLVQVAVDLWRSGGPDDHCAQSFSVSLTDPRRRIAPNGT